jgi:hypothetical protein
MLLLVTSSGFQGNVGGRIVVMKEPVVVSPKFRSFSLHIFSRAFQNVTGKVRVDCSVRRNKFTANNPLRAKKKMSMLFVELRTCRTIFALGDCGLLCCNDICFVSGSLLKILLFSPVMILEIKVGSSLAFSHISNHVYTLLLLIICQKSGNRLRDCVAHVQIVC